NNEIASIVENLSDVSATSLIVEDLERQREIVEIMKHEYAVGHKTDPLRKVCKASFFKFDNLHDLGEAFYGVSLVVSSIRDGDVEQDPDNIISDALESLNFLPDRHSLLSLQEYMVGAVSVIDRMFLLKGDVVSALDSRANFFKRMAGDTFFTAENYISLLEDKEIKTFLEREYQKMQPIETAQNLFQKRCFD
ncbi:MAG: hypothetical protein ACPG05_03670, partial [Bdellovibrionales bacterium]